MAEERNIRIEDFQGNSYFPHAKAKTTFLENGKNVEDTLAVVDNKINSHSVESAKKYNELFQSANNSLTQVNNGKASIAAVVGGVTGNNTHNEIANRITDLNNWFNNLLQSGDRSTLSRTGDWIQQRCIDLAGQLNAKGTAANGGEGLSTLISKVANISTGVKYASGTATGYGSVLIVSGITFQPKVGMLLCTSGDYYTVYFNEWSKELSGREFFINHTATGYWNFGTTYVNYTIGLNSSGFVLAGGEPSKIYNYYVFG